MPLCSPSCRHHPSSPHQAYSRHCQACTTTNHEPARTISSLSVLLPISFQITISSLFNVLYDPSSSCTRIECGLRLARFLTFALCVECLSVRMLLMLMNIESLYEYLRAMSACDVHCFRCPPRALPSQSGGARACAYDEYIRRACTVVRRSNVLLTRVNLPEGDRDRPRW